MSDSSFGAIGACAALLCLFATALWAEPRLEFVHSFKWDRARDSHFGGLSGLELDDDGIGITALSDRGMVYTGLIRREGGKIQAVEEVAGRPILGANGETLDPTFLDAEGLARSPDGRLFISFEGNHRVAYFKPGQNRLRPLARYDAIENLQLNSGLEALALDLQGRLIAIPERSGRLDRPFPVYRLEAGKWSVPYSVTRRPPFLVVGADTGPDDRLYILERDYTEFIGFTTRVRSFAFGRSGLTDERTLLVSQLRGHDNLEGISVWRGDDGQIRVAMISDDNFNFFQRTEIVEYLLVDKSDG